MRTRCKAGDPGGCGGEQFLDALRADLVVREIHLLKRQILRLKLLHRTTNRIIEKQILKNFKHFKKGLQLFDVFFALLIAIFVFELFENCVRIGPAAPTEIDR